MSVLEYTSFCTRINIFVLRYIFFTEKHIVVLEYILLYWNVFFCPGIHIVVL